MMQREHVQNWLFTAALVAAVFLAYQPAWQGEFVWDDDAHITRPDLRSASGLVSIWTVPKATQQYYPLLHSAFWVQHRLWGDWPLPYHLVNILLHITAALLVAFILRRLAVPGAFLAAAIFALHPVQVESVAWITEMKNTLSAVFYLGAAWMYLDYDEKRTDRSYQWAMALFVLALLSKPVTSTLPAALLVVFWWRRGRLSWRQDVRPLLPFFALGIASGLFAAWVERRYMGAEGTVFDLTFVERCLLAGRALWFYLAQLFWPAKLIFVYPRWDIDSRAVWQYIYPAAALVLLIVLWALRRRWRGPLAGLLFFTGTLLPVLGFFNAYLFRYTYVADHFLYLASLGIITVVAGGVAMLLERFGLWRRPGGYALCLGLLAVLAVLTFRQSRMYVDSETVYRTTIARNPVCWMACNNLGKLLSEHGQNSEAKQLFERALELHDNYPEALNNYGILLAQQGQLDEAVTHFRESIRLAPAYSPKAHFNLGRVLVTWGCIDKAKEHFEEALKAEPSYADARRGLDIVRASEDKMLDALAGRREAARRNPKDAALQSDTAWLLATDPNASVRNGEEAVELAEGAVQLTDGRQAKALDCLAAAHAEMGRFSDAVATARKALDLATQQGKRQLADDLRVRLALYKAGKPFRQTFSTLAPSSP